MQLIVSDNPRLEGPVELAPLVDDVALVVVAEIRAEVDETTCPGLVPVLWVHPSYLYGPQLDCLAEDFAHIDEETTAFDFLNGFRKYSAPHKTNSTSRGL